MSKSSNEVCDELAKLLGSEIREMAGYNCLGIQGQEKVSRKLKELVAAIKEELLRG